MKFLARTLACSCLASLALIEAAYAGCGSGTGACANLSTMVTSSVVSSMVMPQMAQPAATPSTPNSAGAPVTELSSGHTGDQKKKAEH